MGVLSIAHQQPINPRTLLINPYLCNNVLHPHYDFLYLRSMHEFLDDVESLIQQFTVDINHCHGDVVHRGITTHDRSDGIHWVQRQNPAYGSLQCRVHLNSAHECWNIDRRSSVFYPDHDTFDRLYEDNSHCLDITGLG